MDREPPDSDKNGSNRPISNSNIKGNGGDGPSEGTAADEAAPVKEGNSIRPGSGGPQQSLPALAKAPLPLSSNLASKRSSMHVSPLADHLHQQQQPQQKISTAGNLAATVGGSHPSKRNRVRLQESQAVVEQQIAGYVADLAQMARDHSSSDQDIPSLAVFLEQQQHLLNGHEASQIVSDAGSTQHNTERRSSSSSEDTYTGGDKGFKSNGRKEKTTDKEDLEDVLDGLRYVMESSIDGGRMPHLDFQLMKALSILLLIFAKDKETYLLVGHKLTEEAHMAFALFGDFLEEVYEFRKAVGQYSATDLKHRLKLHTRLNDNAEDEQRYAALAILGILVRRFPQYTDWRELVIHDEHDDVEEIIEAEKEKWETPRMPEPRMVLCPPGLYYDRTISKVECMFDTSLQNGLSESVIPSLLEYYEENKLPSPPRTPKWRMLLHQVTDFMVIILILAAVISVAAEKDFKTATVLLIVVVLNMTIGFVQEVKANAALEALMSLHVPKARIVRDGKEMTVQSFELVPGDVVILEEGDSVPADLRLIETAQLEIIETILSGESVAVEKSTEPIKSRARKLPLGDCKGNAFMATVVAKGRGKGIVVRTGDDTEIGKISQAIQSTPNVATPIERKLKRLGIWLVALSIGLSILFVVINIARGKALKETIKVGVALAVSVIPEGLVTVVTITMALAVRRMAQRNAIVRKLPSVETLGSVNVICSDKTGTLTEGKMGVSSVWLSNDELYTFTGSTSLDPNEGKILLTPHTEGKVLKGGKKQTVGEHDATLQLQVALLTCALCSNAKIRHEDGKWKTLGDPTEVALVIASLKANMSREFWEMQHKMQRQHEYAFDSDRKLMSVVYSAGSTDSSAQPHLIFAKGAPEGVLSRCTHYIDGDGMANRQSDEFGKDAKKLLPSTMGEELSGCTKRMNAEFVQTISSRALAMANSGLRVLGLAYGTMPNDGELPKSSTGVEKNLVFVGLIGLIDPPRPGVKESVQECKTAGIKVVMITGDHVATASAIARQLGIMDQNNHRAIKGTELDVLTPEQIGALNPFPVVFARVSPDNKLAIVKALQKKNLMVAMTGDGVNDAPAIKAANVGVAMGVGGTEITKQAADIVLANDDFSTIVDAVEEGRRVFDNIQKFLVYLLSCNSCEIWVMLFTAIIGAEMPLTSMMILFANIIADVPPSMALGLEPREKDVMLRPPRDPNSGVLSLGFSLIVVVQGLVLAAISLGAYFWGMQYLDVSMLEAKTLCFVTLTMLQLNQGFLSRSVLSSVFRTGITENRWMVGAWILSVGLLLVGCNVSAIARVIDCQPLLHWEEWVAILISCVLHFICSEMVKLVGRQFARNSAYRKERDFVSQMAASASSAAATLTTTNSSPAAALKGNSKRDVERMNSDEGLISGCRKPSAFSVIKSWFMPHKKKKMTKSREMAEV